ncbi:MAG: aminopeptidase P family protein [Spirochaetales bacterium]|nr:aminopeptidase P family protein [Spirochaetales bacterium]
MHEKLFEVIDEMIVPKKSVFDIYDKIEDFFSKNDLEKIPNTIPVSINCNQIIYHGKPILYELKEGDVLIVDVCFSYNGILIDGAKTYVVGVSNRAAIKLINDNRNIIKELLTKIKADVLVKDVIKFLNSKINDMGYYLFPDGMGHGIGNTLHEPPFLSLNNLENFNWKFKPGDYFTIEPILFIKKEIPYENILGEGILSENNIASQFEVSVFINEKGEAQILNRALIN